MKVQKYLSFFLALFALNSSPAKAELISAVDLNAGLTSLSLKSADLNTSLSDFSAIEINYFLKHPGTSLAYVLSFAEMLRTQGVSLPYTRLGVGLRYYPLGFNGSRMIMDQDITAQVWKATPFLGLTMGLANVTVPEYNASLLEIAPRFGVELPFTATLLLQGQLILLTGSSTGSSSRDVTYQGVTGLVGLILTGF